MVIQVFSSFREREDDGKTTTIDGDCINVKSRLPVSVTSQVIQVISEKESIQDLRR
jgi:hypothetical protein